MKMNVCCKDHSIWDQRRPGEIDIPCIAQAEDVIDILKPGPLRLMYQNYSRHRREYWTFVLSEYFVCWTFTVTSGSAFLVNKIDTSDEYS